MQLCLWSPVGAVMLLSLALSPLRPSLSTGDGRMAGALSSPRSSSTSSPAGLSARGSVGDSDSPRYRLVAATSPVWETGSTLTCGNGASAVIPVPSGVVADNVVVVSVYKESTATITAPSGWTSAAVVATNAPQQASTYWHRAGGAESGNVTFTWTGSTYRCAIADRFSGVVTSGSPLDGTPATAFTNSNVSTSPAVSATVSVGTLQYWMATNFGGGSNFDAPTGYTKRENNNTLGTATKSTSSAGSTGSVIGTTNVSGAMTATLLSLQGADTATASSTATPTPTSTASTTPTPSASATPSPTATAIQYVDIQPGGKLYDAALGIGVGVGVLVFFAAIHTIGSWGNK